MEFDKTQLQWLVAGAGVVIVVLIYLWGIRARIKEGIRKRRRQPSFETEPALENDDSAQPPPDPLLNAHDFMNLGRITPDHHLADKVLVDVEIHPINRKIEPSTGEEGETDAVAALPVRESRREPAVPPAPHMTVVLTVLALRDQTFKGSQVRQVAEDLQLQLNAAGLFERFPDEEATVAGPVFSMAHLREPGVFDLLTVDELTTPGVLLFMNLPGPVEEMKALELMVVAADQLARRLRGTICDERRHRMTNQSLMHLRNQVADLERRRRVWTPSS